MKHYAAYLKNTQPGHSKHYVVAVVLDSAGTNWIVRTAWGRIGATMHEREYCGGKGSGAFATPAHANAYAKAIVRNKVRDRSYTQVWSSDLATTPGISAEDLRRFPPWFVPWCLEPLEEGVPIKKPDVKTLHSRLTVQDAQQTDEEEKRDAQSTKIAKFVPKPWFSYRKRG